MNLENRLHAFAQLGKKLLAYQDGDPKDPEHQILDEIIRKATYESPWFIRMHIEHALAAISRLLKEEELCKWTENYPDLSARTRAARKIGVVMAGNIPAVGFHDFLCVLMAGHKFLGKLSGQDKILIPALADILLNIEPAFGEMIQFTQDKLQGFDAAIATGNNNTARYFEYYFGKYPCIIRRNRNGVAVLDGSESKTELEKLGDDVFLYFGLGCRNVSKIYLPQKYTISELLPYFDKYTSVIDNHKYRNNYDYFKSIYLINREDFSDNGFLLMKEDSRIASPVSVLLFERYNDPSEVQAILAQRNEEIQCIVASCSSFSDVSIPFGSTQEPGLMDYADGIDTMKFLLSLN
ncbi:MAG: acyl-CoA reductase [Bacteroidota bacterium]|nr:acyl-CoA reductase [Bacteroidota bacterium]